MDHRARVGTPVLSALLMVFIWPAAARAQKAEPSAPPPEPVLVSPPPSYLYVESPYAAPPAPLPRRGTHFLLEAGVGMSFPAYDHLDGGASGGATLGIGGKLRGFPPRFYWLFAIHGNSHSGSRLNPTTGAPVSSGRDEITLLTGLRVAFPLFSPIRLVVDVLGGGVHTEADASRLDGSSIRERRWSGAWQFALALQYRVSEPISVGVRLAETVGAENLDVVAAAMGSRSVGLGRTDVTATLGYHF